ncbi:MAG: energy transducer TonB [Nitrospirota bacterium]
MRMPWAWLGSLVLHLALAGGLLWAASTRVAERALAPGFLMVELVAEAVAPTPSSFHQRPRQHVAAPVARPVETAPGPSVEPIAQAEFIDEVANTAAAAVPTEAPAIEPMAMTGDDAPAETAHDAWTDFYAAVRAAIERAKRYPSSARRAGQEDRVTVSFLVRPDGRADELTVVEASHYPILTRAALETVQRVARFPQPPPSADRAARVIVPMVFSLRNQEN